MNHADQISIIIAEDNPGSSQNLLSCLANIKNTNVVGVADNGNEAVKIVNQKKPDLMFLDVDMPGKNGFEVLQTIDYNPGVIFVTAHEQFAVKAFEVNGIDYIVKPVTQKRLEQALDKARSRVDNNKDELLVCLKNMLNKKEFKKRFAVKTKDQVYIIPTEEIFEFKAEDKYVFLCTFDNSFFYNATLKQLTQELDPQAFVRVNKSHIVSIDKIKKLKKNYKLETCLVLRDQKKTTIKISKSHLGTLKKSLEL